MPRLVLELLDQAVADPASLSDADYIALLSARDDELEALAAAADRVRLARAGDDVSFVVNRNLETAAVAGAPALLDELVDEAVALGATEICIQGPLPVDAPTDGYLELIAHIADRAPQLHLHGFRPAELLDGAARTGQRLDTYLRRLRDAGLGSVPGTGAKILDDAVRTELLGGPDLPVREWVRVIRAAHSVGLRSTSTMVYGHIETPAQQVSHLRQLLAIQADTGGFTEFIAMPVAPAQLPASWPVSRRTAPLARPVVPETRGLHAVARLLLAGQIDHVQVAWTKVSPETVIDLLRGGADDLGGLLLDGTRRPEAGSEVGRVLTRDDVRRITAAVGRSPRQRTTLYGSPDDREGPEDASATSATQASSATPATSGLRP